ncbi:hypothetical protein EIP86_006259 [Pleurotus ostreatoroseus]|nr:hypothetical protein EIP86_006259 [Pleurotus ostreatoroseus]
MDTDGQSSLRLRKKPSKDRGQDPHELELDDSRPSDGPHDATNTIPEREDVVWGKTPGGEVFRVPTTHDVLTLFDPRYPKSHIDLLNLGLLGSQIVLFFLLPRSVARIFFLIYFAFWRGAYDVGLGWVLTKQSKKKWIVKEMKKLGWLDEQRKPAVRNWIRKQLAGKMGKDYSFDELPLEYNTWLLFRQAVDIILLKWIGGIALIAFNLWVKTEAHHVVKDYGWYWGDVFFQRGALVFDGVFELAPHPMYSVGYAGYYGLSLISGSYPVLFVSIAAHAAQFGFLVFFENPRTLQSLRQVKYFAKAVPPFVITLDIERTYGQRKLLAARTPVFPAATPKVSSQQLMLPDYTDSVLTSAAAELSTPSVTEGESAAETDGPQTDYDESETEGEAPTAVMMKRRKLRQTSTSSTASHPQSLGTPQMSKSPVSQHDLFNRYFRKDAILLHNIDLLRATDFQLVLFLVFVLVSAFIPSLSEKASLALYSAHTLTWCLFHSFGLGLLLRAQSERKFLVRHFLKHYHYPRGDDGKGALYEAFSNWKSIYNTSMCMTYASFIGLAWKTYSIPNDWTVGNELLRHTLGAMLIGLQIWTTLEQYEVLGPFGWFFGDFFMEQFSAQLEYTGIYRYLNNPEIMSGAAFFGLALISGSKTVFTIAVIRHLSQLWFLSKVEHPHMRKLYGDSLRSDAGFVKVIKKVAKKNARMLETRAGRHAPEIRRVAREVKGTFDKVYVETAEVLEEFLAKSRPKISEVVQDTKVLLQQSRERLVISRVASDLSRYDKSLYQLSVVPNSLGGSQRFHLGEPIRVKWRAPFNHSRQDWIGIYRVGANASSQVTKISSLGLWVPVHNEEWDGDLPLNLDQPKRTHQLPEEGEVVFQGGKLPWRTGKYEIRYHHDGKYNVMSLVGPIEIYVDKPSSLDFASVRASLSKIVTLCLDSDPSLIPLSARAETGSEVAEAEGRDPDDFRFWSERQAKRISVAIHQAFGVELTPEVIIADANISALANRIIVSRDLFSD